MRFQGIHALAIAPFRADGSIDEDGCAFAEAARPGPAPRRAAKS